MRTVASSACKQESLRSQIESQTHTWGRSTLTPWMSADRSSGLGGIRDVRLTSCNNYSSAGAGLIQRINPCPADDNQFPYMSGTSVGVICGSQAGRITCGVRLLLLTRVCLEHLLDQHPFSSCEVHHLLHPAANPRQTHMLPAVSQPAIGLKWPNNRERGVAASNSASQTSCAVQNSIIMSCKGLTQSSRSWW